MTPSSSSDSQPRYTPSGAFRASDAHRTGRRRAVAGGLRCWRAEAAARKETPMQDFGPMKMTFEELEDFLAGNPPAPAYVAVATVRRDGSPFVTCRRPPAEF